MCGLGLCSARRGGGAEVVMGVVGWCGVRRGRPSGSPLRRGRGDRAALCGGVVSRGLGIRN